MTTTSSPNRSYQDTLMELYGGRPRKDSIDSSGVGVVVHGNGSPFHPPQPSHSQPQNHQNQSPPSSSSQPSSSLRRVPSKTSVSVGSSGSTTKISPNGSTKNRKKKKGSSYHFIPMFGKKPHRHQGGGSSSDNDSDSDSDDDYNIMNSNDVHHRNRRSSNGRRNRNESGLSDSAVLRDIFTVSADSAGAGAGVGPLNNINSTTPDQNENAHSQPQKSHKKKHNGYSNGGGSSAEGRLKSSSQPLHPQPQSGRSTQDMPRKGKGQHHSFTSPLGQRIWRQYQISQQHQHHHHHHQQQQQPPAPHGSYPNLGESSTRTRHRSLSLDQSEKIQQKSHHVPQHHFSPRKDPRQHNELSNLRLLPSPDFLRLPSTLVQIRCATSNRIKWVNTKELERQVLQHHLDLESLEPAQSSSSPLMKDQTDATTQPSIRSLSSSLLTSECFTRVIERDPQVGLGMSLREYDGCVYIQALLRRDGSRMVEEYAVTEDPNNAGPAFRTGLLVGDRLLGLNGKPFLKGRLATLTTSNRSHHSQSQKQKASSEEVLKSVGDVLSNASSPMVLHIQRESDREPILTLLQKLQTEMKEKNVPITNSNSPTKQTAKAGDNAPRIPATVNSRDKPMTKLKPQGPIIHPFAKAMSERNLIKKGKEEALVTRQMRIFTDRTRQWESKLSFRLRSSDYTLRPLLDARDVEPSYYASFLTDDGEMPAFFDYKFSKSVRSYAPSTSMIQDWRSSVPGGGLGMSQKVPLGRRLSREQAIMADLYAGLDKEDADVQGIILGSQHSASSGEGVAYPSDSVMQAMVDDPTDVFVPLMGVRKAICVRILNSFLDNKKRTAFTIWCYDVESGMEWYAPVRYYNDFKDLRLALMRVDKTIGDIPFPSLGWSLGGFASDAKESTKTKEARRSQLEIFLRRVFAGLYRGRLHPSLAEVAVHLQTFVGCDTVLANGDDSSLSLSKQVAISESSYGKRTPDPKSEPDNNARMHLKRSIQRYVYRIFLLPSVEQLVSQFVNAAMEKVMSISMGPTTQQSHQFSVDKGEATKDVEKIRDFIDQVQELILEGCGDDFISISQRRDFVALVDDFDNSVRDNLFRDAVREQTELEVYVPLRSTISKYLVYAWFNEDMEMKHKMKALAGKPQSYFRIPKEHRSRSDWKSVSRILQEGVGRSTLPCVKLRAVVDAAKEISKLDSEERSVFPDASFFDGKVDVKVKTLGADDFLPIFIFCFSRAKIERPFALCELLSVMCDPAKMNGETGYYLATFHAALTHMHELDLTEAENDLSIIFDT